MKRDFDSSGYISFYGGINNLNSRSINKKKISVHHIIPVSRGGSNKDINRLILKKYEHEAFHILFVNKIFREQLINLIEYRIEEFRKQYLIKVLNIINDIDEENIYKQGVVDFIDLSQENQELLYKIDLNDKINEMINSLTKGKNLSNLKLSKNKQKSLNIIFGNLNPEEQLLKLIFEYNIKILRDEFINEIRKVIK